jgi:hypothetical protein
MVHPDLLTNGDNVYAVDEHEILVLGADLTPNARHVLGSTVPQLAQGSKSLVDGQILSGEATGQVVRLGLDGTLLGVTPASAEVYGNRPTRVAGTYVVPVTSLDAQDAHVAPIVRVFRSD